MLFTTHVKLGKWLMNLVVIFNTEEFIKGLYQADFNRKKFGFIHTESQTFNMLKDTLKELNDLNRDNDKYSYNLGVIVHYLTDYMTSYHRTMTDYKRTFRHVIYEIMADIKWAWDRPSDLICDILRGKMDFLDELSKDRKRLKNFEIDKFILEYIEKRWERDIDYDSTKDMVEGIVLSYMVLKLINYKKLNSYEI